MSDGRTLDQIFAARARRFPERTAVTSQESAISYRDLDAAADRVARTLRGRGVGAGTLVGLCCEPGIQLIVGLLGILRAGGAYLPLDPAYPQERLRLLLADSAVGLAVGSRTALASLDGTGVDTLALDDVGGDDDGDGGDEEEPAGTERAEASADDPAYVIYTSGSTGVPKGVPITHRNVARLFSETAPWFGFSETDVWTLFHSISFDFSVWEVWGALLHGGRLVVVPPRVARTPAEFLELLDREQVTVLNQTPSAFRGLAAGGPAAPAALRLVVFGGERLDVELLEPWLKRNGDELPRLVNMYGITETTVHVTYRPIRQPDLLRPEVSPIGTPIPDLTVSLCDEHGAPVPDGVPGEIRVSGPGVASGYLNRPELTAERFVTAPDGSVAYRSGDLAVRSAGGELEYLGRIDDQIKVRGYRIEPREVEAALRGHPAVDAAVVTSRDYGDADVRLIAFIQTKPGSDRVAPGADLAQELSSRAAELLPAHMRPSRYAFLTQIPTTAHGKIDLAALRRLDSRVESANAPAAEAVAATATEAAVARIVEDVLRSGPVPPERDLFDLGATSLAFVRIIAKANEDFGVALTGSELGDTASVRRLAAAVDAARDSEVAQFEPAARSIHTAHPAFARSATNLG